MNEEQTPETNPLKDPEKLTATTYQLAVIFECVSCAKVQAITDPQFIAAALRGLSPGLGCPACGALQRLDAPKKPEEPRVVLAHPSDHVNRAARRAMGAKLRHGLGLQAKAQGR